MPIGAGQAVQQGASSRVPVLVSLWVNQVIANGGTVSAGRITLITTLITSLKTAGAWQNADDYFLLVAENAPAALTSLKQRRLGTAVNGPTFGVDTGYVFDGVSNYVNAGYIPSTNGGMWCLGNIRQAAYERTNSGSNNNAMGCTSSNSGNFIFRTRNTTTTFVVGLGSGSASFLLITDSRGYSAGSRAGNGTTIKGSKNGVALTDATGIAVTGTVVPTVFMCLGGTNAAGVPGGFRPCTLGLVTVGGPISTSQETDEYNAFQTYMTAVGANV